MHSDCDVLILTAKFGNGHMAVAEAITSYVKGMDASLRIQTVDFYEIINPFFIRVCTKAMKCS